MIKRTSRNFKVPLVYGGQWKKHQTFQKWDPVSKRLVTYMCDCNPKIGVVPPPPPPPTNFYYTKTESIEDFGPGNFLVTVLSLPFVNISISNTTNTSQDASSWLSTEVSTATYIKIQKDLSNYLILERQTSTDNGNYWDFFGSIFMSAGIVNAGDSVEITYT
jgi:hypothetical protein